MVDLISIEIDKAERKIKAFAEHEGLNYTQADSKHNRVEILNRLTRLN